MLLRALLLGSFGLLLLVHSLDAHAAPGWLRTVGLLIGGGSVLVGFGLAVLVPLVAERRRGR